MTSRLGGVVAALFLAGCAAAAPVDGRQTGAGRLLPGERTAALVYVALGDSTVEGVGASSSEDNYVSRLHERLRGIYPLTRMTNLGVGGATASGVRKRQLARAIKLRPDLVTLSIGPNDITEKRSLDDYSRDIDRILQALTVRTTAVVVVNLIPDLGVTPRFRGQEREEALRQRVLDFNEVLSRHALAYGAEIVDLYGPSQREVPRRPELVAVDRYHPSDAGYALWAELMWVGIEARVPR